ncbi:hypothetical protein NLI96_g12331 [Meripilus lineatus]|uniref:DUF4100 domain-containing protein n=1 Tax=Meripilus lineatus TaxID=2056292 RepID=A0AAD5UQ99_9APHY|nr:hypothetical protein NLI96_g12331 [Physisporinus lineatus]
MADAAAPHGGPAAPVPPPVHIFQFPIPQPGTTGAPFFEGKYPSDFLDSFETVARHAGYQDVDLPGMVHRYCKPSVRDVISNDPVFAGNDWQAARNRFKLLYQSGDSKTKATFDKLRKFCKKAREEKMVKDEETLDKYHRGFTRKAGDLVTSNRITEKQRDLEFYQGISNSIRKHLRTRFEAVVVGTLSSTNPPTMANTLKVVRDFLEEDDINACPSSSDSSDSDSDDDLDDSSSSDVPKRIVDSSEDEEERKARKRKEKLRKKQENMREKRKRKGKAKHSDSFLDEQDKKFAKMNEKLDKLVLVVDSYRNHVLQPPSVPPLPVVPNSIPNPVLGATSYPQPRGGRRCYMCNALEGVDLNHPIGFRSCPEAIKLIHEGIIMYSKLGKLVRADGSELPRAPPGVGIAQLLRSDVGRTSKQRREKDEKFPLIFLLHHQQESSSVVVGDSSAMPFAVANPVQTRSQAKQLPSQEVPRSRNEDAGPSKNPTHTTKPSVVHPSNTEQGWLDSKREKRLDRMEEKQESQQQKSKVSVRFTSDIQDELSFERIQEAVLGTKVTLPLKDILGMSPDLQKRFASLTKTRREVRSTSATCEEIPDEDDPPLPPDSLGKKYTLALTFDKDKDDPIEIVKAYAHAIAPGPPRFYAMSTGVVEGYFGASKATYLVDCGSELNLVSNQTYQSSNVDLDPGGKHWTLRGINDDPPIRLLGCCKGAPIEISNKFFNHHFFVTPGHPGGYDGVLGQPWLHWYSSRIDFDRFSGDMDLSIWSDGRKRDGEEDLVVRLTGSRKSRAEPNLVHAATPVLKHF